MEPRRVLLVDDDRDLVELMEFTFNRAGFEVLAAYDVDEALVLMGRQPDVAVVDINLGARDGFELLTEIRSQSPIPVLMLTARDNEDDTVRALDMGATDYITKPFSHRELVARIRASLRRTLEEWMPLPAIERVLEVGPLRLDSTTHDVALHGMRVDLTVTEFRLLRYLMINAGAAVSTRAIIHHVWGYDDDRSAVDTVRTTMHRLRRKLGEDTAQPALIHTVPRVGFMLRPRSPAQANPKGPSST
jgi:two-component system, OmpR family, response regulator